MKKDVNYKILILTLLLGILLWNIPAPSGLESKSWHMFVIFITTIFGIITSPMPMGSVTLFAITTLVLTKTLTLHEALSGFSSHIAWLVVIAFFIAKGFIKTGLGKRIAYLLISRFGKSTIGLSYSLLFTELLLSPMIPSSTARGGGIIFPIAKSLGEEYAKSSHSSRISAFLIKLCFHGNVITCAMFLTSMAGNPLAVSLAKDVGVTITWTNWALATIVPGIINLLILPFSMMKIMGLNSTQNAQITHTAKEALKEMGSLTKNELIMLITFILMLVLWIFGAYINIDSTTAALIGLIILLSSGVLKLEEAISEKGAWETLLWFGTLLMLSDYLTKFGVTTWIEGNIKHALVGFNPMLAITLVIISYFYVHYFFASVTAHMTVMYTTYLLILVHFKVPGFLAAIGLAILSNLSGGLTHFGISSAPIYFGSHYLTTKEWWKVGGLISTFNLIIWIIAGAIWWKILGWW